MLQGAIIGGVVGLIFYFVQQHQKKKQASTTLDGDVKVDNSKADEEDSLQ